MQMPTDLTGDDFLNNLMVEVNTLTEEALLRSKVSDLKKKKNNHQLPKELRDRISRELEDTNERLQVIMWNPIANVAFFTTQKCDGCGSEHSVFLQYMQKQETTRGPKCTRYQRVNRPHLELPNETIKQITETHVCCDCIGDHGFDLATASSKFKRSALSDTRPFSVSSGYVQEELG